MLRSKRFLIGAGIFTAALPLQTLCAEEQPQIEQRVERLEDKLEGGGFAEVIRDLERIKEENRELRGEIEQLNHQVKRLEKRQHSLYEDLDDRLAEMRRRSAPAQQTQKQATSHAPLPALQEELTLSGEESGPTEQIADEEDIYQEAFNLISDGLFKQARDKLSLLLGHYPDGRYAANALYWIAETYYAASDLDQARDYFNQVVKEHSDSNKAPDALLKLGFIAFDQDNLEEAMTKLKKVNENHPETPAAELARQRMADIRRLMSED